MALPCPQRERGACEWLVTLDNGDSVLLRAASKGAAELLALNALQAGRLCYGVKSTEHVCGRPEAQVSGPGRRLLDMLGV